MITYNPIKNAFEIIQNTQGESVYFEAFCQELLLWSGENPLNVNLGIDYAGVLNGSVYLPLQVQDIISRYEKYFKSIVLGNAFLENEIFKCEIIVTFSNNTSKIFRFENLQRS